MPNQGDGGAILHQALWHRRYIIWQGDVAVPARPVRQAVRWPALPRIASGGVIRGQRPRDGLLSRGGPSCGAPVPARQGMGSRTRFGGAKVTRRAGRLRPARLVARRACPSGRPRRTIAAGLRARRIVDPVEVRGLAVAHVLHLLHDARHLLVRQDRRLAEDARLHVEARQRLDLDRQRQRPAMVRPSAICPCWPRRQAIRSSSASSAASDRACVPKVA